MSLIMEIVRIVLPVAIIGGIGVFVVYRMKHKYDQGTLGRKNSKAAQNLLDSLMPLGSIFGCALGIIFSTFSSTSLLSGGSLGAGIGLLIGYFAYEIYSKTGTNQS